MAINSKIMEVIATGIKEAGSIITTSSLNKTKMGNKSNATRASKMAPTLLHIKRRVVGLKAIIMGVATRVTEMTTGTPLKKAHHIKI